MALKPYTVATKIALPTTAHSLNSPKLVSTMLDARNPPKKQIKLKSIDL